MSWEKGVNVEMEYTYTEIQIGEHWVNNVYFNIHIMRFVACMDDAWQKASQHFVKSEITHYTLFYA